MVASGCAAPAPEPESGLARSEQYAATVAQQSPGEVRGPAASLEGRAMTAGGRVYDAALMWPLLAEAAGGVVAQELALLAALDSACDEAGIVITEAALDRERALVESQLTATGAGADTGALLARVRASRGLGPERFAALLRRNAMLRALVRPDVQVTESAIVQAYRLEFGPTRVVRLITTDQLAEASAAIGEIRGGRSFSAVAAERSTDPSRVRGGLIGAISLADPAYPEALRTAAAAIEVGEVSSPVALDRGFAVVMVDAIEEDDVPALDDVRDRAAEVATLRAERVLMEAKARELQAGVSPRFFDASLRWSWGARSGE